MADILARLQGPSIFHNAKAENKYKGRAPTARAKADEIKQLAGEGMTRAAIAVRLEIGVASVYRVLAK